MTQRIEDVRRRQAVIEDIGEVVGALRAIAAARAAGAQGAVEAIGAYGDHIAAAFARLAIRATAPEQAGPGLTVVVGAAQGFCGGYPARVAAAALGLVPHGAGLIVIGQRSRAMLEAEGVLPVWSADLPAAPAFVPALASKVTDVLLELGPRHPGPIAVLSGTDDPGLPVAARRIWPPPMPQAAPPAGATVPPLTTLEPAALIHALLAEMLFAELARAIMQGLQAESRARVEAMARAASNLKTRRQEIERQYRQARQEQMTTELLELAAASGDP